METSQIIKELRDRHFAFDATGNHKTAQLFKEAADLIEELQDKPWVESVQVDKLSQRIDELENDKTNLEAEIINLEIALDKAHCELVRCGECKYFIENTWECVRLSDRFGDEYSDARVYPEYYCADGERKEKENESND